MVIISGVPIFRIFTVKRKSLAKNTGDVDHVDYISDAVLVIFEGNKNGNSPFRLGNNSFGILKSTMMRRYWTNGVSLQYKLGHFQTSEM